MGLMDKLFPTEKRAAYNVTVAPTVDSAFSLDSLLNTDAITEEKIMKIPTAKACLDLISGSIAQMPVYMYKENADGSIERVNDKRVRLLNHEANDFLNGYGLKKYMVKDYLLHGASYVSKIEAGNTVLELHPLPAKSIVVNKRVQNGYRTIGAEIVLGASETASLESGNRNLPKFKPYELIIALQDSHDGLAGKGIISHGQEIFKQALSEMEFTSNLYERGALPLGLLKTNARLTEPQTNALRDAWRNLYGGIKNAAKTVVLQEGMEYEALSLNPNDMQMTETRKGTAAEICKLFNVPESLVNSTIGKQYVSIEQNNLHYLKTTLAPVIAAMEAAMDRALLLESEKDSGYFFRFDTSELVRTTHKEQVETLKMAVESGIYTKNEARAALDKPAIEEEEKVEAEGESADGQSETAGTEDA